MQTEETVEVKNFIPRNVDESPHRVVSLLTVRHNDIQTIGSSALKNNHQPLGARARSSCAKSGARQKARQAAVPTTASAPLRINTRRVTDIVNSFNSYSLISVSSIQLKTCHPKDLSFQTALAGRNLLFYLCL